jgi:hypothetical protein
VRGLREGGSRPSLRRPLAPRVVPAGGDVQHPTHRRNPEPRPIRAHEFERRDGTERVSVANHAAAFEGPRALRAGPGSHAASGWVPAAQRWPSRHGGGSHRASPAPPSCASTARLARTPSPTRPDCVSLAPTQSFSAGTPAHTVDGSWASWLSFIFPTPPLSTKPGQLQTPR